ncbi:MAG: carbohydrate kinase [Saprospiraceae bacterium]|nr:carbohydrate kinase [Saprospiraceae bacterium]MBK8280342.1 carbohydrate kinase [Saprospiraceae bacterium]
MQKIICFGEILWDMLPQGKMPGGAPMNVAFHLHRLGLNASPLTALGKDDLGYELADFLRSKLIPTDLIQWNDQPTGQVLVQLNEKQEASYNIQAPAAWDFIKIKEELLSNLNPLAPILVFGSLACRSEINRRSLQRLWTVASLKICDINLRTPFYNQELVHHLFSNTDWIKINHEELTLITSWFGLVTNNESDQANLLLNTFPEVDMILVTRGDQGAAYYDRDSSYSHPGYKVEVVDTIGSGDSFLAMFLAKALSGLSPEECLRYACAMGASVAARSGATPDFDLGPALNQLMSID